MKKKILISLFITILMAVLVFVSVPKAKAEVVEMEGNVFILNSAVNYTGAEAYATATGNDFVRDSNTRPACFQLGYYATNSDTPITYWNLYIKITISRTSGSTTTYIYFDFYTSPNDTTYLFRLYFYVGSNSSTSYMTFQTLTANGPTANLVRYSLTKGGLYPIVANINNSGNFTTTTFETTNTYYKLFTRFFTSYTTNYTSAYYDGYRVGMENGQNQVISDPNNYGLYSADQYNDNYDDGYTAGYNSYDSSTPYNNGYDAGYSAGQSSVNTTTYYNNGYSAGYNAGLTMSSSDYGISDLLFSIFNVPIAVLSNVFSFSIFGTQVWTMIVSLLVISVTIWIIKRILLGVSNK